MAMIEVTVTTASGAGSFDSAVTQANVSPGGHHIDIQPNSPIAAGNYVFTQSTYLRGFAENAPSFAIGAGKYVTLLPIGTPTISADISGPGSLAIADAVSLSLSGSNSYADTVLWGSFLTVSSDANLGSGTILMGNLGSLEVTATTNIDNTVNSETASFQVIKATASFTLSGSVIGVGHIEKLGSGTLTLSGTNSYAATKVSAGALSIASDSNLGSGAVTLAAGATLQVTGATTIDNNVILSGSATYNSGVATTLSGVISGSGDLTKTGAGTLTLSGTSTYSGATTVSAGKVMVTGTIASATTVQTGGTLGGTGTAAAVTVQSGGTLAPGASPGVFNTGNLSLASGATFAAELGGATSGQFDQAAVTGTVALGGATLNLSLFGGYSPTSAATYRIIDNDGSDAVTGTFNGLAEGADVTAGGLTFKISYVGGTGNDVVLTYTPPAAPAPTPLDPNVPTAGNDIISLPAAGGRVEAGIGDDKVTGGDGSDFIHGNIGFDTISAGAGADTALGGQGDDSIHGNQGADVLSGDLGNDTVQGGQGADTIFGGDGADYLSGDLGDDRLSGGAGADIFNFRGGQGRDTVTDFGAGDHIWLSTTDAASFQALGAKMAMVGADTVISLSSQTIVLQGVQMSSLTAGDFVFS